MSVTATGWGRKEIHPKPHSEEAVLDLVNSRYEYSKNTYQTHHQKCSKWYDMYRMIHRGEYDRHKNVITLPLVLATIQSDVARKMNTLFNVWPILGMFGFGPEDAAVARKNELLISAQLLDCKSYVKAYDFILASDMYGTGVCQHGWRYDEEMLMQREQVAAPVTRRFIERMKTQPITVFDGPNWDDFDLVDSFPQPGQTEFDEMAWFIRRMKMDLDDIRVLKRAGIYDDFAVGKLETYNLLSDVDRSFPQRPGRVSPENQRMRERYRREVEIIEMWGTVPSEMVPDDKGTQRVITVANGKVVLRNRPNPFWHGQKPFLRYCPIRDQHEFYGMGKAQVGEKLQYTANKLACQKLDALDLFIDPQFIANQNLLMDRRKLRSKPGAVHYVNGPPRDAIEALVPNMTGVQNAMVEIQDIWRWYQQGSGIIEDVVMGVGTSARTTAREFMGRMENVSVRLLLETRMAEEMWLVPLGQMFRAYNRQMLDVPHQIKILGMNAIYNPVTGEPIPPEDMQVTMDDLNQDYDVRAMGSTQAMGKQERVQRLAMLFQMASTHPAGMALINWVAFFREMFLANELYNTQELLTPLPGQAEAIQMVQGMKLGSPSEGAPEQGEGGGGPPINVAAGLGGLPPLPPVGV